MFTGIRSPRAPEESARAFAYRVLSMYIREMLLHPGERLAETDVAGSLRISRTPVHDTFSRLVREKMLRPVSRGVIVAPLRVEAIRQAAWMHRTLGAAVLGELYNRRPASWEPLKQCVAEQYRALENGAAVTLPRLTRQFWITLYRLANRLPVLAAIEAASTDLYRLLRMTEDRELWRYIVDLHAELVSALDAHDHETAVRAWKSIFDLTEPMAEHYSRTVPQYFADGGTSLPE